MELVPTPNLPMTGADQDWSVSPGPEPGIWTPGKLSQDFKGGLHMIGGSGEGRMPFDDYGAPRAHGDW